MERVQKLSLFVMWLVVIKGFMFLKTAILMLNSMSFRLGTKILLKYSVWEELGKKEEKTEKIEELVELKEELVDEGDETRDEA
jgi:hypothetical protein